MATITNLAATTELEAVNAMLSAIGESPVATVDTSLSDVALAISLLRDTTREVQGRRWRFNTEFGYVLTPSGVDGALNVFEVPSDLLSFTLSYTEAQSGMDAIIRRSRTYTKGGERVLILADRLNARDGWEGSTLRIDPVWLYGFEEIPEAARRYITISAARKFAQQIAGSEELGKFTEGDEQEALRILVEDQRKSAPVVPAGVPVSETHALNRMLQDGGLDPVPSVESLDSAESVRALNLLRTVVREVQAEGWRFNTEFGYEVAPSDTLDVTHSDGTTATLNIFRAPDNLASFAITNDPSQQGSNYLDVGVRESVKYRDGDGAAVKVFYDRAQNRDGFIRDYLYINPVWILPFETLPESARRYITSRASRQFIQTLPSVKNAAVAALGVDEAQALRTLRKDQGASDDYNILQSAGVYKFLGGRPMGATGVSDWRGSPGVI